MELEYWILDRTLFEDSAEGGYGTIFTNIKETTHLDKKGQKLLKKLYHSKFPDLKLQTVQTSSLEEFRFETLPLRSAPKKYNVNCNPWPEVDINDDIQSYTLSKEKLRLEEGSRKIFIWLTNLPRLQTQYKPIAKHTDQLQETERFKIRFDFLPHYVSRNLKSKKREFMPSFLGTRFKETLTEDIFKTTRFSFGKDLKIEHDFCNIDPLKNYILETTELPVPPRNFTKFQQWPLPRGSKSEVIFEILRSKLFDLEFNKLEFFKINTNFPRINGKITNGTLSKKWKMSKHELKSWDWNPFKQTEKTTIAEIVSEETIVPYDFNPPIFEIGFHKIPYSSFDFVNLEKNSFESLKFASASRLDLRTPRTPKNNHPVIHEKEGTPDVTTNSELHEASMEPHKRSFIDDSLLTIIDSRKKCKKYDDCNTTTTSHGPTMFRILNSQIDRSQKMESSSVSTSLKTTKKPQIPFEPSHSQRSVLINANKIWENHKIIQYLSNETQLQLVEQELPFKCDFIIDASSCIFIAQLELFFQIQADNTMFYEHTLKSLPSEFKTVIVLIKYPEVLDIADRDVFWKIRLFLQPPEFQLFLTKETPQCIGKWIDILSNKPRDDDQSLESHPFLLLQFNKFLVQELLSNYTLEQILLMATTGQSKELSALLTNSQLKRVQKLMALGW